MITHSVTHMHTSTRTCGGACAHAHTHLTILNRCFNLDALQFRPTFILPTLGVYPKATVHRSTFALHWRDGNRGNPIESVETRRHGGNTLSRGDRWFSSLLHKLQYIDYALCRIMDILCRSCWYGVDDTVMLLDYWRWDLLFCVFVFEYHISGKSRNLSLSKYFGIWVFFGVLDLQKLLEVRAESSWGEFVKGRTVPGKVLQRTWCSLSLIWSNTLVFSCGQSTTPADLNVWTSDRRCPGGALTGVGSCRNIQKLQLSPLFFLDIHLCCSNHTFRSLKPITRLRPSGSLSNTERQKPPDWRRAEQCGGEKEGPGRKMLLLVTRSLLCPHCQILASSPAQLAAWCDLQLFSQQRSAAQLFSGHYKIIPRSDWHGRAVCSQLPDLNICCNDTRGTMKIRDAPHRAEHFFFLNCNLISIWLNVILITLVHFSVLAWNKFQEDSS